MKYLIIQKKWIKFIYIYIYKEIQILSVTFVQYLNIHHLYCGCS